MANTDMAEYWNGRPAEVWVREAERFDSLLAPFGRRLLTAAVLKPGERVLDVGCGNGAIALAAARAVGRHGRVTKQVGPASTIRVVRLSSGRYRSAV